MALANPFGNFDVSGKNPDGSEYHGRVSVQKSGEEHDVSIYKISWDIGGKQYDGTGIGVGELIAVSYESGDETGLALYTPDKENWKGIWTHAGGTHIGAEFWTRK
jgi:hypothetical protein